MVNNYVRRDDALMMPDDWRMARCAGCGSIYLVNRPDDESLPRAYADYYTHKPEQEGISNHGEGVATQLVNGYLNARYKMYRQPSVRVGAWLFRAMTPLRMKLDVYGRHIPLSLCCGTAQLLDVGCGNGAFLSRAKEMGMCVRGVEPDPAAVTTCRHIGLDVRGATSGLPSFRPIRSTTSR